MKTRIWIAAVVVTVVALGVPVARALWYAGPRRIARPRLPAGPPDPPGIVIHHSDTPGTVRGKPVGAAKIDEMHRRRGFGIRYHGRLYHIGYHYVIREDGTIETGRPEHCPGAHSRITEYNRYLGICLIGTFSDKANPHRFEPSVPTGEQLRSLVWLCSQLAEKYHLPTTRILCHRDVRDTICPGENFPYHWVLWEVDRYRPVVRARMARLAAVRLRETGAIPHRLSAYSPAMAHDVKVNE